jgi:hypothetical protein
VFFDEELHRESNPIEHHGSSGEIIGSTTPNSQGNLSALQSALVHLQ